MTQQQHDVLRK